jgi:hypothetical protein
LYPGNLRPKISFFSPARYPVRHSRPTAGGQAKVEASATAGAFVIKYFYSFALCAMRYALCAFPLLRYLLQKFP